MSNLPQNKSKKQRNYAVHSKEEILAENKRLNDPKNPGWEAEKQFRQLTQKSMSPEGIKALKNYWREIQGKKKQD